MKNIIPNLVNRVKTLAKKTAVQAVVFMLIGFFMSKLITPNEAVAKVKSGLSTGCNAVFQNNICSAVGLKKATVLQEIFSQTKEIQKSPNAKTLVKTPAPVATVVAENSTPKRLVKSRLSLETK